MELWSNAAGEERLAEGIHMFHFSCEFPRVNFPQSHAAEEYEIAYVFEAQLVGASQALSASQTINFEPETVAPLPLEPKGLGMRYVFSDKVQDADDPDIQAFGLHVTGLQQAFVPGDMVDFQVRVAGQRALRRAQYVLYEQTDCFYPQIPKPHEEQLDLGRRLWTTRKAIGEKRDLPFERDTASMHGAKGSAAYYAHLHALLPPKLLVLHESAFLRVTYYVELTLFSTAGWSGHVRRAQARVPVPVASRVLPEPMAQQRPAVGRTPSVQSRGSSASAQTDVDWPLPCVGEKPLYAAASSSKRLNRSITDLGARLQQLIPRRLPSTPLGHRGRRDAAAAGASPYPSPYRTSVIEEQLLPPAKPASLRAAAHCTRIADYAAPPQLWPPGASPSLAPSDANLATSPLSSTASLVTVHSINGYRQAPPATSNGAYEPPHRMAQPALRNQQLGGFFHAPALQAMSANGYKGGFSTAFLTRLHDMYHVDAHRKALGLLLVDGTCSVVIPNAMVRPLGAASAVSAAPRAAGSSANRDHALGLFFDQKQRAAERTMRRHSRIGDEEHSLVDRRLWPTLVLVMTTYRNPWSNQITTWSAAASSTYLPALPLPPPAAALSADRHRRPLVSASADDACVAPLDEQRPPKQQARYSRISALSVSSNDTACVSNGRLSLAKDIAPADPHQQHHAMILNDLVVSLDTIL
ncbi:hypothetical protein GGI22_003231 [Coemansia erecta]|nr:hypothetical protein GGI22_003231 [Coemansia erecta]